MPDPKMDIDYGRLATQLESAGPNTRPEGGHSVDDIRTALGRVAQVDDRDPTDETVEDEPLDDQDPNFLDFADQWLANNPDATGDELIPTEVDRQLADQLPGLDLTDYARERLSQLPPEIQKIIDQATHGPRMAQVSDDTRPPRPRRWKGDPTSGPSRMSPQMADAIREMFGPGSAPMEAYTPEQLIEEYGEHKHGSPPGRRYPTTPGKGLADYLEGKLNTEFNAMHNMMMTDEQKMQKLRPIIDRIREKYGIEMEFDGEWFHSNVIGRKDAAIDDIDTIVAQAFEDETPENTMDFDDSDIWDDIIRRVRDSGQDTGCPQCSGDQPMVLGPLGDLLHVRCQHCGWDYALKIPPKEKPRPKDLLLEGPSTEPEKPGLPTDLAKDNSNRFIHLASNRFARFTQSDDPMGDVGDLLDFNARGDRKFLTGKNYPHMCPTCQATIDRIAELFEAGELPDTDDPEAPIMFSYDHSLLCGGNDCAEREEREELENRKMFPFWTKHQEDETHEERLEDDLEMKGLGITSASNSRFIRIAQSGGSRVIYQGPEGLVLQSQDGSLEVFAPTDVQAPGTISIGGQTYAPVRTIPPQDAEELMSDIDVQDMADRYDPSGMGGPGNSVVPTELPGFDMQASPHPRSVRMAADFHDLQPDPFLEMVQGDLETVKRQRGRRWKEGHQWALELKDLFPEEGGAGGSDDFLQALREWALESEERPREVERPRDVGRKQIPRSDIVLDSGTHSRSTRIADRGPSNMGEYIASMPTSNLESTIREIDEILARRDDAALEIARRKIEDVLQARNEGQTQIMAASRTADRGPSNEVERILQDGMNMRRSIDMDVRRVAAMAAEADARGEYGVADSMDAAMSRTAQLGYGYPGNVIIPSYTQMKRDRTEIERDRELRNHLRTLDPKVTLGDRLLGIVDPDEYNRRTIREILKNQRFKPHNSWNRGFEQPHNSWGVPPLMTGRPYNPRDVPPYDRLPFDPGNYDGPAGTPATRYRMPTDGGVANAIHPKSSALLAEWRAETNGQVPFATWQQGRTRNVNTRIEDILQQRNRADVQPPTATAARDDDRISMSVRRAYVPDMNLPCDICMMRGRLELATWTGDSPYAEGNYVNMCDEHAKPSMEAGLELEPLELGEGESPDDDLDFNIPRDEHFIGGDPYRQVLEGLVGDRSASVLNPAMNREASWLTDFNTARRIRKDMDPQTTWWDRFQTWFDPGSYNQRTMSEVMMNQMQGGQRVPGGAGYQPNQGWAPPSGVKPGPGGEKVGTCPNCGSQKLFGVPPIACPNCGQGGPKPGMRY